MLLSKSIKAIPQIELIITQEVKYTHETLRQNQQKFKDKQEKISQENTLKEEYQTRKFGFNCKTKTQRPKVSEQFGLL